MGYLLTEAGGRLLTEDGLGHLLTEAAFPDPAHTLGIKLELNTGGTWTDVTSDCDHGPWVIGRGHPDESTSVVPSTFSATLSNTTARYSPDNVMSDLWPNLVQNMPARVSIPAASNYMRSEAGSSDRAYVSDTAALHVTGSVDARWYGRLTDWSGCMFAARRDGSTGSWHFYITQSQTRVWGWWD